MATDLKYTDFEVIIFDLGNTILPIAPELTLNAFQELGFDGNIFEPSKEIAKLLSEYQKGKITTENFLSTLKKYLPSKTSKEQIVKAWNAMLLDFPEAHLKLLEELKHTHELILLSNTNALHADCFEKKALELGKPLASYFNTTYYSHQLGLSKPTVEIYKYVHSQHNLQSKKVLFLDDIAENLVVPQRLGWKTVQITEEKTILSLL